MLNYCSNKEIIKLGQQLLEFGDFCFNLTISSMKLQIWRIIPEFFWKIYAAARTLFLDLS